MDVPRSLILVFLLAATASCEETADRFVETGAIGLT